MKPRSIIEEASNESDNLSSVSFVKLQSQNQLRQDVLNSLDLIHFNFPHNLENVVIKPNMCYYWDYSTGQTTDPRFVGALIDVIRNKTSPNVKISIVESDASAMRCKHVFRMLGYEQLAKKHSVRLVNLSEDFFETVQVKVGKQSFKLPVAKTILQADLKINVPKIKYTMDPIKLTCALKNIFGCIPFPRKSRYHPRLGEAIVGANKAMRFDLCVVDGNIVSGIQPRRLGLVITSRDPVAIDAAAAKIAGLNRRSIKYLQVAQQEGLGTTHYVEKGLPLDCLGKCYPRKDLRRKFMGIAYKVVLRLKLGQKLGLE
jgi:uncharacterized protein (DUF362 family)